MGVEMPGIGWWRSNGPAGIRRSDLDAEQRRLQ
jgi:hypothetical protein